MAAVLGPLSAAGDTMLAGADGEPLPFASPLATGVPLGIRALRGVLRVAGRVPEPAARQSG